MTTTTRRRFTVFLGVVVVILSVTTLLALSALFYVFVGFKSGKDNIAGGSSYEYQYLKVDTVLDESVSATVSIQEQIPEGEFKSYVDNDGNHILLSSFGTEEFECTGECYCATDRRGFAASTTKRSVMYLVAAASSIVAMNIASSHFGEECLNVMEDDPCPTDSIQSEVHMCRKKIKRTKGCYQDCPDCLQGKYKYDDGGFETPDEPESTWLCKGECKFDTGFRKKSSPTIKRTNEGLSEVCKNFKYEQYMTLRVPKNLPEEKENTYPRRCFAHRYLSPWCRTQHPECMGHNLGCKKIDN